MKEKLLKLLKMIELSLFFEINYQLSKNIR
jgi:hypothetical protein